MRMKGKKRVWMLAVAGALILGGGLVYRFVLASTHPAAPPTAAQLQAWQYTVDKITTNLQGNSIIQVGFTLQAPNAQVATELGDSSAQVNDVIIGVLHDLTASQVMQPGGRTMLKRMVLERVNAFLTTGKITAVYVDSLIVQ